MFITFEHFDAAAPNNKISLRLPYRNDAEIAKFCNLWTFWPVILLINHLFKIRQKAFLSDFKNIPYWLNYKPKHPKVAEFCYFSIIPIW